MECEHRQHSRGGPGLRLLRCGQKALEGSGPGGTQSGCVAGESEGPDGGDARGPAQGRARPACSSPALA